LKTALVITSISAPNHVLRACAEGCQTHGIDFIVIGDRKSPADFRLDGCDYWSIARQLASGPELARLLPEGHYSRKNLGYLIAMERGAEVIIETDDDNLPLEGFWAKRCRVHEARRISAAGWVNPYSYFTDEKIWPRGFPLDEIKNSPPLAEAAASALAPIQQGLTDGNPDVDAIYRLTRPLPLTFRKELPLAIAAGAKAPFNSQNTSWFKEAFPLLYLPSTCSFRMTDIWRSFVAMRICAANGWDILFNSATVFQERNPHDLMTDFRDEISGYLGNTDICRKLDSLTIESGVDRIPAGMVQCYEAFINKGMIDKEELALLNLWLSCYSQAE
jgi:hypothetical protein